MTNEPRRTRLLASGLLVLTFVVGGLAGAATERLLRGRELEQPTVSVTDTAGRRPERARGHGPRSILLEPGVLDQLEVNGKQRTKIMTLLAERDTALQKIWREMQPRMDAIRSEFEPRLVSTVEESRAEVRAQLNAKQIKMLDQMIQERREQRARQNHNSSDPKSPQDSGKTKMEHLD
jgi:hypothetical protein